MAKPIDPWKPCLHYSALTDIGMRRSKNQDAHLEMPAENETAWRARGHLFIVADGMGAHAAGELASRQAVEGIAHLYNKYLDQPPMTAMLNAVQDTNAEIHRRGRANVEFFNMGTTCSTLLLLPEGAYVAHVGDSRVYRLRNGELQQLTFDHSLVWEMRAAGQMTGKDSRIAIPKNVITRSVGPQPQVQVDLEGAFPVAPGDTFLLCSDGLTGRIDDSELAFVLAQMSPADAGSFLVDLTNLRGGPDNITAVIVRIDGESGAQQFHDNPTSSPSGGSQGITASRILLPALWIAMGIGLFAAFGLLLSAVAVAGWTMLVVCVLIGIAIAGISLKDRRPSESLSPNRLGRAPYCHARPTQANVFRDEFAALAARVQDILQSEGKPNLPQLPERLRSITQAFADGNMPEALRLQAAAAHDLISLIRGYEGDASAH